MPEKCKYEQEYFDFASGKTKTYKCEEDAVEGGLCIFHHKTYWKEHKNEVRKKFMEKVEDAIRNKNSLLCIGYNLPEVDLSDKKFEASVYFTRAIFHEGVIFARAKFSSTVDFSFATFFSLADFSFTEFSSEAEFNGTTFSSFAYFRETIFSSLAYAYFSDATFKEIVSFVNLKMNKDSYIVFLSCTFEKPRLVFFAGTEIMRFLFLNTEIEKISLRNAKFNEKILKVHELLKDPKFQFKSPISQTNYTFDDVIETYGRLRGNLERNHRFSEAGKFFIGEMEVRRTREYYEFLREHEKSKKEGFKEWLSFNLKKLYLKVYTNLISPFALYKAFSEYGESVLRPIAWSLLTIFATPILFILLGGQTSLRSFISSYGSNLVKSFGLFAQILPVDYPPLSSVTLIEVLERLLAILFAGLELMALKRRLERHR
jgi:uncharacterized protein YjbI with pentapeptide repeats